MKWVEISSLLDNLKDEDALVRENAAYVLGEQAYEYNEIARNTLKNAEQQEKQNGLANAEVRRTVIESLIACLTDHEPWVRGNAAEALGKLMAEDAVLQLESALTDDDHIVRLAASDSLGQIGNSRSIDRLGEATRDEEWSVRISAVKALANFDDPTVLAYLEQARSDANQDVRLACIDSIETHSSKRKSTVVVEEQHASRA